MKAVLLKQFGGIGELYIGDAPVPEISAQEVLVKVGATALNRADLLQRKGLYPPPPGESEIIGLEMAGVIENCGSEVKNWKTGDRVFALLAGGGYAEYVRVHQDMLMPIPDNLEIEQAAGIAEAFLTAWQAVVWLANLQPSEDILIHAGASGVGTAAIQIANSIGANIWVTASPGKHPLCEQLGAAECIDYRTQDFVKTISEKRKGGVDVLIDFIGAPYFSKNLQALGIDGRMVMLGFMGGMKIEQLNLAPVLFKRLKVMGSTLRARRLDYKIKLTRDFKENCLPQFSSGVIRPVIDSVFDWQEVQKAHAYMEANKNQGKVILKIAG
ncbi:MAG: NAD(P)H-quinone oxidoreductase [Bacteroidota bacterium]